MLFHPRHSKYCRFSMQPKVKGPAGDVLPFPQSCVFPADVHVGRQLPAGDRAQAVPSLSGAATPTMECLSRLQS